MVCLGEVSWGKEHLRIVLLYTSVANILKRSYGVQAVMHKPFKRLESVRLRKLIRSNWSKSHS